MIALTTRRGRWAMLFLLLLPFSYPAEPAMGQSRDATALMRKMDELWRGDASEAIMSMTVKTRNYQRAMRMQVWSKGKEHSLVRILSPKKDRGISTLKVEKNIWNYLPKINRVTKVPSSMMMGSWMGSHFTNDDLVRESSLEEDYASSITFEGQRDGKAVYEVTLLPRPDAPVVWGKIVYVIEQETLLPLKADYFDEEGAREREMVFSEAKNMDGRLLPTRMELRPVDKPGEFTAMVYEKMNFNPQLPDGLFSLQGLRKKQP